MSPETLTMADRYPEEHASQALEEDQGQQDALRSWLNLFLLLGTNLTLNWQHFEAQRHSSDATALTTSS